MTALINRHRMLRLASFASTQLVVQVVGFVAGIVLLRGMPQVEYGYYTLAVSMVGMAVTLCDLGLSTAVLANGGRLLHEKRPLGALMADARALHRRLGWIIFAVLLPCFVAMLMRQNAPGWQVAALAVLIVATAWLQVRTQVLLAAVRLLGHVGAQQKLDLTVNFAKLAVLAAASWWLLEATLACAVNLAVAAATLWLLGRHLRSHVTVPAHAAGDHFGALRKHLWKQAPNSIYFVCSSQLALWLLGIFGTAERVAEAGALGRLGAVFTLVASVSATLVMPYFARRHEPAELAAGFAGVNGFYAVLLALLLGLAWWVPEAMLWVLGSAYAGLQTELVWMVAAATLSAWGGAAYGIACSRDWVMPVALAMGTGVVATLGTAWVVDVATVRGSLMINTATGLAATLTAVGYFLWRLRLHAQPVAVPVADGLEAAR